MKNIGLCVAIFSLFLAKALANTETLIVPVDPWPPWKFVNTETWQVEKDGVDVQFITTLISTYNKSFGENITIDYRGYPWKRCLEMMRSGKADLISGVFKRPEREAYMVFIEPPYKTQSVKAFYIRKDDKISIRKYEDLYQLKIGAQAGVKYFERFDDDPNIQKQEAGNDLSNFRKLELGRIDAVISTETQADYLIASQGFKDKFKKATYKYTANLPVYFAISKKSAYAKKAAQFSEIVQQLVDAKAFDTIVENYFNALHEEVYVSEQ
jgi:polar amino acid transport system substrate-binding protein